MLFLVQVLRKACILDPWRTISCSGLSPGMSVLAMLGKGAEAGAATVLFPSIACSVLEMAGGA